MSFCEIILHILVVLVGVASQIWAQTYEDTLSIFNDKLSSDNYNVDVRPVLNQSLVLYVGVTFEFLAVVDLSDVSQSFTCNGIVSFLWKDEKLVWDPASYGGQSTIHPQAKDIWRPNVILANTLEDRDIFGDNNAPVSVWSNGSTIWLPGSTFPVSCGLIMTKYPFDVQTCQIVLVAMNSNVKEVQYVALTNEVGRNYLMTNGEWNLVKSRILLSNFSDGQGSMLSGILIRFVLKRNPAGFLINILLPVVFISFLNLTVFLVPVESGEKISYGTTVLMALSVFMTTVSSLLPISSLQIPYAVLYIFALLIISLLTVITTIVIVFLHHKEEKETHHLRAKAHMNRIVNKVASVRRAVDALDASNSRNNNKVHPFREYSDVPENHQSQIEYKPQHNKYRVIGKYIDMISLVVFFTAWLSVTLMFFIFVSS